MHARSSSCQPTHLNGYNPLRRPSYPLTPPRQSPLRPVSPPSPLARYHTVDVTAGSRRSICDLIIPEEAHGLSSDLSATLHNHIDLSLEFLKRHHKPKSPINQATSDPQILSTNTTHPVHIPSSPSHLHPPSPSSSTMATLAPRADSFNARVRGTSHIDFKTATTGVAAKAMRNEISRLVGTVEDLATKKVCPIHPPSTHTLIRASQAFDTEMQAFFYLFTRYLSERAKSVDLSVFPFSLCRSKVPCSRSFFSEWDLIKSPAEDQIVPYDTLVAPNDQASLNKLAVLKVNGGLGTSMGKPSPGSAPIVLISSRLSGMTGAKSALEVKDDMTFLDLTVRQIEHLNTNRRVDVPLILMTSFNTHEDTLRIIKKYANQQVRITTFNQSRYPRIFKESLLPCPKRADDDKKHWYPPGHGDVYNALFHSGVLDQLLAEGKEYLFVSNSDNLGAV
jgi:UTP--glucose-1-phosphate uridylyltransferase